MARSQARQAVGGDRARIRPAPSQRKQPARGCVSAFLALNPRPYSGTAINDKSRIQRLRGRQSRAAAA
jgi:hypothetical protein